MIDLHHDRRPSPRVSQAERVRDRVGDKENKKKERIREKMRGDERE